MQTFNKMTMLTTLMSPTVLPKQKIDSLVFSKTSNVEGNTGQRIQQRGGRDSNRKQAENHSNPFGLSRTIQPFCHTISSLQDHDHIPWRQKSHEPFVTVPNDATSDSKKGSEDDARENQEERERHNTTSSEDEQVDLNSEEEEAEALEVEEII